MGRIMASLARELPAAARWPLERRRLAGAVPEIAEDPLDPALTADAPAWWRELHARGPVHYSGRRGFWIISGYEAAEQALRDHETFSSADGVIRTRARLPMMLTMDRPDHARLRRLVARDFTTARVAAMAPRLAELASAAIETMLSTELADAQAQIAAPVPVEVIADVLAIPNADRHQFRRWSDEIVVAMAAGAGGSPLGPRALAEYAGTVRSSTRLMSYFYDLIQERRRNPGNDVLSALSHSELEGGLDDRELFWFCLLLLVAGNETTTSLISGLFLALAQRPGIYAQLRTDPENQIPRAVEEGLRWTSPVQAFFRQTRRKSEVSGVTIPARSRVMISFGAANRDPTRFDDPDEFRLDRPDTPKHLAFGSGIHFCLGAHLARLEAGVILEQLTARVDSIELAGAPRWSRNPSLRQITALPLRLSKVGQAG